MPSRRSIATPLRAHRRHVPHIHNAASGNRSPCCFLAVHRDIHTSRGCLWPSSHLHCSPAHSLGSYNLCSRNNSTYCRSQQPHAVRLRTTSPASNISRALHSNSTTATQSHQAPRASFVCRSPAGRGNPDQSMVIFGRSLHRSPASNFGVARLRSSRRLLDSCLGPQASTCTNGPHSRQHRSTSSSARSNSRNELRRRHSDHRDGCTSPGYL